MVVVDLRQLITPSALTSGSHATSEGPPPVPVVAASLIAATRVSFATVVRSDRSPIMPSSASYCVGDMSGNSPSVLPKGRAVILTGPAVILLSPFTPVSFTSHVPAVRSMPCSAVISSFVTAAEMALSPCVKKAVTARPSQSSSKVNFAVI